MTAALEVRGLVAEFAGRGDAVRALHGISFDVGETEIVGVVGESGSGKSTVVRSITRLLVPPGRVAEGSVVFGGRPLLELSERRMREIRGKEIGFVAQNPFSALNPVLRLERQFANIAKAHGVRVDAASRDRALRLLEATGVNDPERVIRGYAHELSGGMAQRVVIAMALYLNPRLVIADEPTTALDLTVQRQVLDTLRRLTSGSGRSMLIVTHDLGVVAEYCDRVLVMYQGKLVEEGPVSKVFTAPGHPYTASLLSSVTGPIEPPGTDRRERPGERLAWPLRGGPSAEAASRTRQAEAALSETGGA
ncbi:Peptide ABC transporter ATP-binding protein [Sinomonas atrocyanea]|uniref:Peptide ABC transporter ATP-binding protein n=1 Tax=Sinomonas atrocyanea TaxID=37927 RepID=A0A127A5W4_9MICC|nr:ABC transporter ATP-binding protein [Sinomonas atrocyanea]AMM34476.1 Peptide ABC transporter ATP-binding protein [Sinomonas atrocyanea]GEB65551.1 peptide ABC transporter ATP-binding protein [Sinomonas atrocyanea]GGG71168.1 peptide ABC transporter ATP-binding protein [Sinomonas atrocyanea]